MRRSVSSGSLSEQEESFAYEPVLIGLKQNTIERECAYGRLNLFTYLSALRFMLVRQPSWRNLENDRLNCPGERKGISSHEGKIRNSGNKHCDCRYCRDSLKSSFTKRVLLSKSTRYRYNEIH